MQRHDGFAPWPEVRDTVPFCSLYAAHFLVEAKADGFPVSGQTLTELHALLENLPSDLEPTQQAYAATDAWICREMYYKLLASEKNPLTPEQMLPNPPKHTENDKDNIKER